MIQFTDEEFQILHEFLRLSNDPYTVTDVPHIVALEGKAWEIVRGKADPSSADQPSVESQPS